MDKSPRRRAVPLNKLGKLKPRADAARPAADVGAAAGGGRKSAAKAPTKTAAKPATRSGAPRTQAGKPQGRPDQAGYWLLLIFAMIYAAVALVWHLPSLIGLLYAGASLGCFIVYAIDKSAARKGGQRTPEATLLLLGLLCGWPGAVLAQQWLRHKSSKAAFLWPFRLTVLLNTAGFIYLSSPQSFLRHL